MSTDRYSRQIAVPGWGPQAQARLAAAEVAVVGVGGLGCAVATYLALAGVGRLCLCDGDVVEISNLNRQTLYTEADLGKKKALAARSSLLALNPAVEVIAHCEFVDEGTVAGVVGTPEIVVDCLDNFRTRYLLSDYCARHRIPLVHGGVSGLLAQVTLLDPPDTPCLRCLFNEPPEDVSVPAIGAVCGLLGSIQALEAVKHLARLGCTLKGRLLLIDGATMAMSCVPVQRRPLCPACQGLVGERGGLV